MFGLSISILTYPFFNICVERQRLSSAGPACRAQGGAID